MQLLLISSMHLRHKAEDKKLDSMWCLGNSIQYSIQYVYPKIPLDLGI